MIIFCRKSIWFDELNPLMGDFLTKPEESKYKVVRRILLDPIAIGWED